MTRSMRGILAHDPQSVARVARRPAYDQRLAAFQGHPEWLDTLKCDAGICVERAGTGQPPGNRVTAAIGDRLALPRKESSSPDGHGFQIDPIFISSCGSSDGGEFGFRTCPWLAPVAIH